MNNEGFEIDNKNKDIPKEAQDLVDRYTYLKNMNASYIDEIQINKVEADKIKALLYSKYKIRPRKGNAVPA